MPTCTTDTRRKRRRRKRRSTQNQRTRLEIQSHSCPRPPAVRLWTISRERTALSPSRPASLWMVWDLALRKQNISGWKRGMTGVICLSVARVRGHTWNCEYRNSFLWKGWLTQGRSLKGHRRCKSPLSSPPCVLCPTAGPRLLWPVSTVSRAAAALTGDLSYVEPGTSGIDGSECLIVDQNFCF